MSSTQSPFSKLLEEIKDSKIYFDGLAGNNGDTLIHMGMEHLLNEHGITPIKDPQAADIILLNGGGAMNDLWPEGGAQVLESYIKPFPEKRIIVGPSSYLFNELDFAAILNASKARIDLFCREDISVDLLEEMDLGDHVRISQSQDLAFELANSEFIKKQKESTSTDLVICAMRKDLEGRAGSVLTTVRAGWLPKFIRTPLSKLRDRLVARKSSDLFTPIFDEIASGVSPDQIMYRDISVSVSFDDFCKLIRSSKAIVTDRLHIGILGSMLGKEVHLIPGSYHKMKGVYEFSLKEKGNVTYHQV
ncbi:MAG: polysaccharide pyruvyl transferase family protein [Akkermansiaceae bacterium]